MASDQANVRCQLLRTFVHHLLPPPHPTTQQPHRASDFQCEEDTKSCHPSCHQPCSYAATYLSSLGHGACLSGTSVLFSFNQHLGNLFNCPNCQVRESVTGREKEKERKTSEQVDSCKVPGNFHLNRLHQVKVHRSEEIGHLRASYPGCNVHTTLFMPLVSFTSFNLHTPCTESLCFACYIFLLKGDAKS